MVTELKCNKCGNVWTTKSMSVMVTCSSCGRKVKNVDSGFDFTTRVRSTSTPLSDEFLTYDKWVEKCKSFYGESDEEPLDISKEYYLKCKSDWDDFNKASDYQLDRIARAAMTERDKKPLAERREMGEQV